MAANKFDIPVWDPQFVQWAQNVNAANANKSKASQDQWDKIYGMVRDYGEKRRAEEEAEKARKFQAEEAEKQRAAQAALQAASIAAQAKQAAANRSSQEANAKRLLDLENKKNLGKAQGEIDVLNAERKQALGQTTNEADKANINALYDAKIRNTYSRFGVEAPKLEEVPSLTPSHPEVAPQVSNELVPNESMTEAQLKKAEADLQAKAKAAREEINRMPSGKAKQQAMNDFNSNYGGNVQGYTEQDIKKAGYKAPSFTIGQTLNTKAEMLRAKSLGYGTTQDPISGKWKVTSKRK